jgi:dTDP-4-amino-4,6-dideoxygalactose transaminase
VAAAGGSSAKRKKHNAVAYDLSPRRLNLPSAMRLAEAQVDRGCAVLQKSLAYQ